MTSRYDILTYFYTEKGQDTTQNVQSANLPQMTDFKVVWHQRER